MEREDGLKKEALQESGLGVEGKTALAELATCAVQDMAKAQRLCDAQSGEVKALGFANLYRASHDLADLTTALDVAQCLDKKEDEARVRMDMALLLRHDANAMWECLNGLINPDHRRVGLLLWYELHGEGADPEDELLQKVSNELDKLHQNKWFVATEAAFRDPQELRRPASIARKVVEWPATEATVWTRIYRAGGGKDQSHLQRAINTLDTVPDAQVRRFTLLVMLQHLLKNEQHEAARVVAQRQCANVAAHVDARQWIYAYTCDERDYALARITAEGLREADPVVFMEALANLYMVARKVEALQDLEKVAAAQSGTLATLGKALIARCKAEAKNT